MDLKNKVSVKEIAAITGSTIIGDELLDITSLNEIHRVKPGALTFVDHDRYYDIALYSQATAILVHKRVDCPHGKVLLLNDNPFKAYNDLAQHYRPFYPITATISPTAVIGKGTVIEPNVVIADHVTIGEDCLIRANTTICEHTIIGNKVIINPNTTIGSDAFYYHHNKEAGNYEKWHSIGRVVIHNHVEIGACCTIDKGVSDDTIIGEGTKIDNMVHVGHGVHIGKHCVIAAQVGIAGKSVIQDHVTLYGQVGVSKLVVIGEHATVYAQSGVSKSLQGGKKYFGYPAGEWQQRFREVAALRRLPFFFADLDKKTGRPSAPPEITEMLGQEFQPE